MDYPVYENNPALLERLLELRAVTSIKFFLKVLPVNASSVKQNQCFLLDLADWVTYLTIEF